MKILRLLNTLLNSILTTPKESDIEIEFVEEESIETKETLSDTQIKNVKSTLPPRQWRHLNTKDMYKIVIPEEAFNPHTEESALMCTVIKDDETGESRLIPYMNIPILTRVIMEIHTTSAMANQTHEWEFDIEDH